MADGNTIFGPYGSLASNPGTPLRPVVAQSDPLGVYWEQVAANEQANKDADRKQRFDLAKQQIDFEYERLKQTLGPDGAERWKVKKQIELAREELAEKRRQFDAQFGLSRDTLGLDVLKTAAGLRGPQNYFQYLGFMDQAAGNGLADYLKPYAAGAGAGASPWGGAASLGGMAQGITAGAGGGGPERAAAAQFEAGATQALTQPHKLGNWFGEQGPLQAGLYESVAGKAGLDWGDILHRYGASRYQQGNPFGN